jgi:hypothetical protein
MSIPVSDRLEREARRTSRALRIGAELEVLFSVIRLAAWFSVPAAPNSYLLQAAGGAVGCTITFWMSRRWVNRADWYRTTPEWWLRLDDAPPVVPFPWLIDLLDRPLFRRRTTP